MRRKYLVMVVSVMLLAALVGCSRKNQDAGTNMDPTSTPSTSVPGNIGMENNSDAFDGGGAGGTEDRPEATPRPSHAPEPDGEDGVLDDIGNAAGDLVEGVGDAARGVGNALGKAGKNVRDSMQR